MSKQAGLFFFLALLVVWLLVTPLVDWLLADEGASYLDLLLRFPQFVGALAGSAAGTGVMFWMKKRSSGGDAGDL